MHACVLDHAIFHRVVLGNWCLGVGTRVNGQVLATGVQDNRLGNYHFIYGEDDSAPTIIDNPSGVGLFASNSDVGSGFNSSPGAVEINNCGSHGVELQHSKFVDKDGGLGGSGNAGAGVYAHDQSSMVIKDGSPPTLTGALGDCSLDGSVGVDLGSGVSNFWTDVDAGSKIDGATVGNNEFVIVKEI